MTIQPSDLLDLTAYERVRDSYRAKIIEMKRARRIAVGDRLTFVFENRATVLFQIQEMARAERIVADDKLQAEIDVYSELLPGPAELSATLMVEIPEMETIRAELDQLVGIDEYIWMDVEDRSVQATFDPKQFAEDRISAVQYVRFPLGPALAKAFAENTEPVTLRADHPNYRAATPIEGASRASLAEDLG